MAPKDCATWRERKADFEASHTHTLYMGTLIIAGLVLPMGNRKKLSNNYNTCNDLCAAYKTQLMMVNFMNITDGQNKN